MFRKIENLPDDVLGISFHGKVTYEDYADGVIPAFEEMLEKHDVFRVLIMIHPDFEGFEIAAMWEDMSYGLRHWKNVSHIAMICDSSSWVKSAMAVFAPFFPGEVRSYDLEEMDKAKAWIEKPD